MIPTNFMRYLRYWVTHNRGQVDQQTVQENRLQQWWSNDGSGPEAKQGEIVPDPTNTTMAYVIFARDGEWRNVPIDGES